MRQRMQSLGLTVMIAVASVSVHAAEIDVRDDQGQRLRLASPAQRIITLSPHATELVFAAGAGDKIVATVNASDFPQAARAIARIGDGLLPEPERLLLARPDLLVGWQASQLSSAKGLNIPVFLSQPKTLRGIADSVETLGQLLGTSSLAQPRADALRRQLSRLSAPLNANLHPTPPVRVFLQVGDEPEYSLNRSHLLSEVIERCGGINVFADAAATAPKISAESVLSRQPDLVLLGRDNPIIAPERDPNALAYWTRLKLPAALAGHVYVMDSAVLYRPGPRLIESAEAICALIQQARK